MPCRRHGRARDVRPEAYIKRLEKLEEICESFDGVEKSYAIQAGREVRIMVRPDEINDGESTRLAREIKKRLRISWTIRGISKLR